MKQAIKWLFKWSMIKRVNLKNRNQHNRIISIFTLILFIFLIGQLSHEAFALDKSLKAVGIDQVKAKGLTGKGVNVGQLEPSHPDKTHPMLNGGWIIENPDGLGNDDHATHVVGILMGQSYAVGGVTYEGVAPSAHLQTTGWDFAGGYVKGFRESIDWLMLAPEAEIINMSAGWPRKGEAGYPDDNMDRIADWAAAKKDVLFVTAAQNDGWSGGAANPDSISNPARGYNVLTVGATGGTVNANINTENYKQLAAYSSQGLDQDTYINPDIVAPGSLIKSAEMGGTVIDKSGTSMATPHVAGTAALLHEYSTKQNWNADSRDHKVLKAVLM